MGGLVLGAAAVDEFVVVALATVFDAAPVAAAGFGAVEFVAARAVLECPEGSENVCKETWCQLRHTLSRN